MNLINNAVIDPPYPINEPVLNYAPGSAEKIELKKALTELSSGEIEIPMVIGGKRITTGNTGKVVMPHDHQHVMATYHKAGPDEVQQAIDCAVAAQSEWRAFRWEERAAIFLKAAELLATKYRARMNALAMLTGGRDLDDQDLYSQELAQVQQELERDVERLREYAEELRQLGVEPRNAPKGIIDFPARLEDRDIFLCWKYGEEEVLHWHESDSGFAGRQPIFAQVAADTETDDDGLSPD